MRTLPEVSIEGLHASLFPEILRYNYHQFPLMIAVNLHPVTIKKMQLCVGLI